jgi:predicted porin
MKKLLLATVISALSISAVQAAPKVYGKLFVGTDYTSKKGQNGADDVNTTSVNSNASRFGIKGEDELTPTLSAVYQIEWGVSADGDTKGDLSQRNRFLGLKSIDLGTVKWGRFDTATKESQNKVDLFNDMVAEQLDMKNVLAGENRVNNVIGYEAPEIEGVPVKFTANLILDQEKTAGDSNTNVNGGLSGSKNGDNGLSASVAYDQAGVYVALAGDKKVNNTFVGAVSTAVPSDIIRVVGQFDLAQIAQVTGLTVGALYENTKPSDTNVVVDQQDAYLLSASYKLPESTGMDGFGLFAQYQQSKTALKLAGSPDDLKRTQVGGGVTYAFSPKTTVYGYVAQQKFDAVTVAATNTYARDVKTNFVGMSLEHKF